MNNPTIEELLAICEAANSEPWRLYSDEIRTQYDVKQDAGPVVCWDVDEKDAIFISTARTHFPRVLRELADAREQLSSRCTECESSLVVELSKAKKQAQAYEARIDALLNALVEKENATPRAVFVSCDYAALLGSLENGVSAPKPTFADPVEGYPRRWSLAANGARIVGNGRGDFVLYEDYVALREQAADLRGIIAEIYSCVADVNHYDTEEFSWPEWVSGLPGEQQEQLNQVVDFVIEYAGKMVFSFMQDAKIDAAKEVRE